MTDWGNPNLVRASKGTVFSVPVASDDTAATVAGCAQGVASSRRRRTPTSTTPTWTTRGIAIAVGAEKYGLTDEIGGCGPPGEDPDGRSRELLNVATSAAIVIYEAVRQRRQRASG